MKTNEIVSNEKIHKKTRQMKQKTQYVKKRMLFLLLFFCLFSGINSYAYYCPGKGRWLSRDPKEEGGGTNIYGVVENDLINFVDYLGHEKFEINEKSKELIRKYYFNVTFKSRTNLTRDGASVNLNYNLRGKIVDSWTDDRKDNFKNNIENNTENAWNNQNFKVCKKQKKYSLKLDLIFQQSKADWNIFAFANSRSDKDNYNSKKRWHRSSNDLGGPNGYFDETIANNGRTSGHELGHQFGLEHPGVDKVRNKEDEYDYVGKDKYGNEVNGKNELMGSGSSLRKFYFNDWKKYMNDSHGGGWEINDK